MSDLQIKNIEELESIINQNQDELEEVRGLLSNSYSLFFRNRFTFEYLKQILLPKLYFDKSHSGNELRIWSAGCSEGQEAYSLAILIENFNELKQNAMKYRIFATDREFTNIEKASIAIYKNESLHNVVQHDLERWFVHLPAGYKLNAKLKKYIQFELLDLLSGDVVYPKLSIFGNFDIIMCANVLIYYNEDIQKKILNNFKRCMSKEGYIITGEVERELFLHNGFTEISDQTCIFKI